MRAVVTLECLADRTALGVARELSRAPGVVVVDPPATRHEPACFGALAGLWRRARAVVGGDDRARVTVFPGGCVVHRPHPVLADLCADLAAELCPPGTGALPAGTFLAVYLRTSVDACMDAAADDARVESASAIARRRAYLDAVFSSDRDDAPEDVRRASPPGFVARTLVVPCPRFVDDNPHELQAVASAVCDFLGSPAP